ncbi:MAG: hypothetical protein H0T52_03485 [Lautropia sp.]|nr:hypothetical protein [Lautropia sp.]
MANSKKTGQALPPEKRFRPGPMPTQGDEVRDVGKRALDDVSSKKDTDASGYDGQRSKAPADAPTKRSGIDDGSKS